MPLPAPTQLAAHPTVALGSTGLHFPAEALRAARENGIAPVLMHRLASEDESSDDGPREMLLATAAALEKSGHSSAWGAGGTIRTEAEAAMFATAGFTWFSLDLGGEVDPRAASMSLDELDAAIVALEDSGHLAAEWHAHYTDREWPLASGRTLRIPDEVLARAAVKFTPALAHAAQLQQAIRTRWSGRGSAPDLELGFVGGRDRWSAEEFLFLALESNRQGLCPACIAPPLGPAWQPGAEFAGDEEAFARMLSSFREIATLMGNLKVGIHHSAGKTWKPISDGHAHLDFEEAAWLATLDILAKQQPGVFRRWLCVAQEQFPFAAAGVALRITEEDVHALPQVGDAELSATFLADVRGRQLLLATFPTVLKADRSLRKAIG